MRQREICLILLSIALVLWVPASSLGKEGSAAGPLSAFAGKTYKNLEDPQYRVYDQALREVLTKRIRQRYGIVLDPKKYSGFDLLEILAFLKCKKPTESFDSFLELFPKNP